MAGSRTKVIKNVKKGKIKRKITKVGDIIFDSKTEADFYSYLLTEQKKGNVIDIKLQPEFILQPKFFILNGELVTEDMPYYSKYNKERLKYNKDNPEDKVNIVQAIKYISDFEVLYKDGIKKVIDVKGIKTADFKIKEKMLLLKYPSIKFECVCWDGKDKKWREYNEYNKIKKERKKKK